MGRLLIEITGDLPGDGKYAVLASAEEMAKGMVAALCEKHAFSGLSISVKAVRPSKKAVTPEHRTLQTARG